MHHTAEIKAIKETSEGTWMKIFVPDSFLKYDIERYKQGGKVTTEMRFNDSRRITNEQRAKFYATVKDIAIEEGEPEVLIESMFKYWYCTQNDKEWVSLSDCSVTEAKELITMQIDYILDHGIPLTDHIQNRVEDVDKYLYKCLIKKICSITGRPGADVHHCTGSRVGMGGNRKKIDNRGRELIALSREWHSKVHQEGEEGIFNQYKIYGLTIDDIGLKKLKLSTKDIT